MTQPVVIVGAGGHGRELLGVLAAMNAMQQRFEVLGFLDDGEPDDDVLGRLGMPHLGPLQNLEGMPRPVKYLLGLGSGALRRKVDDWATTLGREPVTAIHPSATLGSDVRMDAGVVICAQASVTTNVTLGRHVHINVGGTVAHDIQLGDYVTLSPGSRLTGNVSVGDGSTLGTGCVILPGVTVGSGSVVGAGAVVTRDVVAGTTVAGVPARALGVEP